MCYRFRATEPNSFGSSTLPYWGRKRGVVVPGSGSEKKKKTMKGLGKDENYNLGAIAAGAVAVFALLAWCLSGSGSKKTMKAPGKFERILRKDFDHDPKGYFRNLHKK